MNDFFDTPTEHSKVKIEIVRKYFWAWAKIISPKCKNKIGYIDLYSGQGLYSDGTKSVPVLIIEAALRDPDIREKLVTIFNDADPKSTQSLQNVITNIENIELLKYKPKIINQKVDTDFYKAFESVTVLPTLFFVDPWGYRGITLKLLKSLIKDWGCDCIFFFNYNRVNMCLSNKTLDTNMDHLFGEQRASEMKSKIKRLKPHQREKYILSSLKEAMCEIGGSYFIPFKFMDPKGKKTSHFLILISKNVLAYKVMKGIMASESSDKHSVVPTYCYSPIHKFYARPLFYDIDLTTLEADLLKTYAGRTIRFKDVFFEHNVDKPYIEKNYKSVFLKMERENTIVTQPPADKRKSNTFGEDVLVTFPG